MGAMETLTDTPRLLTVREAAAQLGCCQKTIHRAVAAGKLPAVRLGQRGRIRIRADLVARIIEGERV